MIVKKAQHLLCILHEIQILKERLQPHDTGHISTAISVLQQRVRELQKEIDND
jgi:hypothetical protein